MENGNGNPSAALIKLIYMKYNIDETWLTDGIGPSEPGWDDCTDEGVIAKYNTMKVLFEQKLQSRTGEDLLNTAKAFSFFDVILSHIKPSDKEKSRYLAHASMAFDEYETIIFAVSTSSKELIPSKKMQMIGLTSKWSAKVDLMLYSKILKAP